MTNDNLKQPGVKIDERLWEEFRNHVRNTRAGTRGYLRDELETAIREYINAFEGGDTHDRLLRIERDINEIKETLSDENDIGEERDSVSKTTENRLGEIKQELTSIAEQRQVNQLSEADVERVIERVAGGSYKTLNRYKEYLVNQRELFPHPLSDEAFFIDGKKFVTFCENYQDKIMYDDVRAEYEWDWWVGVAPDGLVDENEDRGFQ